MVRKILLTAILCSSFFITQAGESSQDDLQMLLEQVDFVLFVLERNTVRMERYGLHELNDDVNYLSKDLSKDHCQFKLSLAGKDFRAHSISWDDEDLSRLRITSGKRREPNMYYLLLSKIFPSHVKVQDLPIICFDCIVHHVESEKKDVSERAVSAKVQPKSLVDVIVPFGDGHLSTQLILDGTVRAVCGFFVQHDAFCQGLCVSGKIKKEDAFAEGILVVADARKQDELDLQEVELLLQQQEQEQTTEKQKQNFKENVLAKVLALKDFLGRSWARLLGLFFR